MPRKDPVERREYERTPRARALHLARQLRYLARRNGVARHCYGCDGINLDRRRPCPHCGARKRWSRR